MACILALKPGFMQQVSAQVGGAFDQSWHTVDGGGNGPITGGVYSMSGTVGQPDAGRSSGGAFNLLSGFWGVADAPLPSLSINDVSLAEGNSGATAFTFTVTLSQASNQTVTVRVQTADGNAVAGSDYVAVPLSTLTFSPPVTVQTVTVTVQGDTVPEGAENFAVNLSVPVNATIADSQGVGTILDDDGSVVTSTPTPTTTLTPTATVTGTITPRLTPTATPTLIPPPAFQRPSDDDDEPVRSRHDQGSEDDTRTEGNVVEIDLRANPRTIVIVNRDGRVTLRLHGDALESLESLAVGQYVVATGTKEHEHLYDIYDLSIE